MSLSLEHMVGHCHPEANSLYLTLSLYSKFSLMALANKRHILTRVCRQIQLDAEKKWLFGMTLRRPMGELCKNSEHGQFLYRT